MNSRLAREMRAIVSCFSLLLIFAGTGNSVTIDLSQKLGPAIQRASGILHEITAQTPDSMVNQIKPKKLVLLEVRSMCLYDSPFVIINNGNHRDTLIKSSTR